MGFIIVLGLLLYLAIGAFLAGWMDTDTDVEELLDDNTGMDMEEWLLTVFLWPLFIILFIFLGVILGCEELGMRLHNKFGGK